MIATIVLSALIFGYCIYVIAHHKKLNCDGDCNGCNACSNGKNLVDEWHHDQSKCKCKVR